MEHSRAGFSATTLLLTFGAGSFWFVGDPVHVGRVAAPMASTNYMPVAPHHTQV